MTPEDAALQENLLNQKTNAENKIVLLKIKAEEIDAEIISAQESLQQITVENFPTEELQQVETASRTATIDSLVAHRELIKKELFQSDNELRVVIEQLANIKE